MSVSRSAVHTLLVAVALCALLASPLLALGTQPATVVEGKTVSLDFSPGFKLPCAHEITITIDNTDVITAVNPPKTSKNTKFKFKGLKPGVANITVFYFVDKPNCSGSASVRLDVEVTPDLKVVTKEVTQLAKGTVKTIAKKYKEGLKFYCSGLKKIVSDFKKGSISSLEEAQSQIGGLGFSVAFGTAAAVHKCVEGLSTQVAQKLEAAALSQVLMDMQAGACGSLWDQSVESAEMGYMVLAERLDKKKKAAIKQMMKKDDSGTQVNAWTSYRMPGGHLVAPPSVDGPVEESSNPPPSMIGGFAYSMPGMGRALVISGAGASWETDVQVDVIGRNGQMTSQMAPLQALGEILSGNNITGFPVQPNEATDKLKGFQLTITSSFITTGDGAPFTLDSGPYRVELRYPGDPNPAATFHVSVP